MSAKLSADDLMKLLRDGALKLFMNRNYYHLPLIGKTAKLIRLGKASSTAPCRRRTCHTSPREHNILLDCNAKGRSLPAGNYAYKIEVENSHGLYKQMKLLTIKRQKKNIFW